jgi:glycosyltransferase involved in cell wall biosynthesis
MTDEQGVRVERFSVEGRDLERWIPYQIRLSEGLSLSLEEQFEWLQNGVNSSTLYARIAEIAPSVDYLFFAPYLFSTTFFGSLLAEQVAPGKSVLIPCLHDEVYAYVDVVQSMFRILGRCVFNASAEQDLARRLYGEQSGGEVGMGFDPLTPEYLRGLEPWGADGGRKVETPYLLYVGRKETGKNAHLLVDYFIAAKERYPALRDLSLVFAGGGSFDDLHRPSARARADIIDLPHLSEHDKHRLMRHALVLCQPSTNESFSIVLMESWLLGTPVLVHARCAVTQRHCVESSGGLYFSDAEDFGAVVERLAADPELRRALARAGAEYVRKKYSWSAVLGRFEAVLESFDSSGCLPAGGMGARQISTGMGRNLGSRPHDGA